MLNFNHLIQRTYTYAYIFCIGLYTHIDLLISLIQANQQVFFKNESNIKVTKGKRGFAKIIPKLRLRKTC